jgi:hypothetical protein
MAQDDLLRVAGPSAGISIETATVDAAGGGGYKRVGPNKTGYIECWVGGLFDRTTGDETIAWVAKRADDAAGTNAATVGTSATQAANNRGLGSTATQDSLGFVTAPVQVPFSTTTTQQYVGVTYDMSGNTPSAASTHAHIVVTNAPLLRSGS